jgi:hypothetical protein
VITPRLRHRYGLAVRVLLIALAVFQIVLPGMNPRPLGAAPPPDRKEKEKPYAVIFGTVWGPDDHPVYGVTVKIRRATDKPKKVRWELYSDHHGEFAQRVPAGEADYILWADLKGVKTVDGKPLHLPKEVTVHIYNDEREDTGLHLTE